MKFKKIILTCVLSGTLMFSGLPAFAADKTVDTQDLGNASISNTIDLQEASPNVIVSDVMTFDQLAERMSTDKGISVDEAKNIILENHKNGEKDSNNARSISPTAATYRTLYKTIV